MAKDQGLRKKSNSDLKAKAPKGKEAMKAKKLKKMEKKTSKGLR